LSGQPDETCQGCGLRGAIHPTALQTKVRLLLGSMTTPHQFNGERYLDANPDVRKAGADPTRHFIDWGRLEGRDIEPETGMDRGRPLVGPVSRNEPVPTTTKPATAADRDESGTDFTHGIVTNSDGVPNLPNRAAE
jgi:hypothetical protein